MSYPINETEFVNRWMDTSPESDEVDCRLAQDIAKGINNAYWAGVEEGKKIVRRQSWLAKTMGLLVKSSSY